jgi:DNA-binding NtrC family response regulator
LDILSAVSDDVYIAKIGKDKYREKFNVKIIIAINEDIDLLLEQKRLRKDIFYRIRHIESFPSLKERLGKDKEHRYLRGLLFTYRWKSISIDIDDIKIGRTDMISSFFPVFTQEALSELANQDWDGNFRELERIAFDLFYECDSGNKSASIDDLRIKEIINSWNNKTTKLNTSEQTNTLSEAEQRKLKDIQYALRKSEFVIADFIKCQHQSYYKSRVSLRTYLKTHKDFLDTDVINDSRIIKFINHGKNTRSN